MKNLLLAAFLVLATTHAKAEGAIDVICSLAPGQSESVQRFVTLVRGVSNGVKLTLVTSGLTIVPHSSTLPILTGSTGYIAGSMTGASVATSLMTIGLVVGGAALTLELACAPKNRPELVQQVIDGSREYASMASDIAKTTYQSVKTVNVEAVTEGTHYSLSRVDQIQEVSADKLDAAAEEFNRFKTLSVDKFYELMGETWYERLLRKTKSTIYE